jgi:hypothetical protein
MRFIDPHPIDCPTCGAHSEQPVKELLALRACCPRCGHTFEAEGRRMRKVSEEWGTFCTFAEIVMCVEDALGVAIPDGDLCQRLHSLTLRDIARHIQTYLPLTIDVEQIAIQMVFDATRKMVEEHIATCARLQLKVDRELPVLDTTSLDKLLLDGVYPNRWERANPATS